MRWADRLVLVMRGVHLVFVRTVAEDCDLMRRKPALRPFAFRALLRDEAPAFLERLRS